MRLSNLLKLSFLGTLIYSPAMAQEAAAVHDEALKVLRAQTGQTNAPSASAPVTLQDERAARAERLRTEAQRRLAERERLQAEKRKQFEEFVRQREQLREQQRSGRTAAAPAADVHNQALDVLRQTESGSTPQTATTAGAISSAPSGSTSAPEPARQPAATPADNATQQRALDIIRSQRQQSSPPAAQPVRESELAPRVTAAPRSSSSTHEQALEVLRQQMQSPAPSSSAAPQQRTSPATDDLKPSPELQRRLDEMHRELQSPNRRSPEADAAYTRELEQRALQMMQGSSAPARASSAPASPAASPATSSRTTPAPSVRPAPAQPRETVRTAPQATPSAVPARDAVTSAPVNSAPRAGSRGLDPAAEERARQILRQQQQAVSTQNSTPPAAQAHSPATGNSANSANSANLSGAPVDYSRELEERARQALLQRNQPQTTAAEPVAPDEAAARAAALNSPLATDPQLDQVHSRALETLIQVQPGEGGQTQWKSKQERLRALTELYRADRMTPAEYHKRRAAILAEPNK